MQITFCGYRKTFWLPLATLLATGCASLSTTEPGTSAAGAPTESTQVVPIAPLAPTLSSLPAFANFADAKARSAARKTGVVPDAQDISLAGQSKPLILDIETQVDAAEQQLKIEAAAEAAIKAALLATRLKHSAWYRMRAGMQMAAVDNKRVRVQLKWYLEHRGYLRRVMERARPILPFVLAELERRNLPTELALLPIVESAYQAFAYSHGQASGLWQIIPSTGRFLGLKQNWWYDGRRDIIESTRAAISYLESLHAQFDGDWELALAAYNAGPGKIRNAVRYNKKKKRKTDFWHLTKIRNETRAYVPKLFALRELFANPDKYQLELVPVGNELTYEVVDLDGQIDLALAAELADISVDQLYQLNPAFNRWATAPKGPHRLLLPREKASQFRVKVAEIPPSKRINWVRHKIKEGETLSHISNRYRTPVALLREVNNLRSSRIRAGKYLMVPTATKSLKSYTLSQSSRVASIQNTKRKATKQVHIVRRGQSLWGISRSYGVSTQALAKWNAMAPLDTLRNGQKLVIWTKSAPSRTANIKQTRPSNALHTLRYTVRKGDSLYLIADRFNISIADIKRWNRVGKYLQPGQKLKLYVDVTSQSS